MKLPSVHGLIHRRLLINFTAEPDIVQKLLPPPFRPQLVSGKAIVGICLIRFQSLRPSGIPKFLGLNTENAAHRIAVEWTENKKQKTGVYVLRRDTSSHLKTLLGGRLFSSRHHHATFKTKDTPPSYSIHYKSDDATTEVKIEGQVTSNFPSNSIFKTLENSSNFFHSGSTGYSPGKEKSTSEGMKLITEKWHVDPFEVTRVESSFFDNNKLFPKGSITFDHALIMRNIPHRWDAVAPIEDPNVSY